MPAPCESLLAKTARDEGEWAARMETPWMLLIGAGEAESVATAMTWLGLHLSEMFWRFEVASEVDRLGAALRLKTVETAGSEAEG